MKSVTLFGFYKDKLSLKALNFSGITLNKRKLKVFESAL